MARCIRALALCFTMSAPFVWSRRISHDNTVASAFVAHQGGMEHNPSTDQFGNRIVAGTASGRAIDVSGFDWATDEAALEKHFGDVGTIESLYFQSNVAAVVTFVDAASAQQAVTELDGTTMDGQTRHVAVKMDKPRYSGSRTAQGKDKQ